MKVKITTNLEVDLAQLLKKEGIAYVDALRFGAQFLLAERFVHDYPDCKILSNMEKLKERMHEDELPKGR